jgi:hypothetical protein
MDIKLGLSHASKNVKPEYKRDKVVAEKYLNLRRRKYQDAQNHVKRSFMICILHHTLLELSVHERLYGLFIWHA